MLTFTENLELISKLADESLEHVQSESYLVAANNLLVISITVREAMIQLDDMSLTKHQDTAPAGETPGVP